jgi:VanZ family protein
LITTILRVVFPLYVVLIGVMSLTPRGPELAVGGDKLAHCGAYLVIAILGMPLTSRRRPAVGMFLLVVAVGAALEGLQAVTPNRTPSGWDLVANSAGAAIGSLVWLTAVKVR